MIYEIVFKPAALRDLKKLPEKIRIRILQEIMLLSENLTGRGVEKLVSHQDFFRLRIGNYRVIFKVLEAELQVLVIRIGHRREIYRFLKK